MKVALAMLCIGAVVFLLRVLAAFVKEGMRAPAGLVQVHFNPSGRQLIEMKPAPQERKSPFHADDRIAL